MRDEEREKEIIWSQNERAWGRARFREKKQKRKKRERDSSFHSTPEIV